ncbi:adenine-specific DNA-methyltransferase [Micromonospora luteifusca]|uniref:site-specific DNA-methyltransferase (adenine-specific) n=1 Tax=Micromonospora luteifusca TaxID=709860 RepID=A0ABS2LWY1_9ACTN|nr:Eco57I restriction-modification methylase domain-containing protein [Micromonospora luteifusca]MBM7492688.1 adenine-specific DNA-methyltransferase [Micromonospora luteifusca]
MDDDQQRELAQFFTPRIVAEHMAAQAKIPDQGKFRILDPGAGSGSLIAAIVGRVLQEKVDVSVALTAVEIAPYLHAPLRGTVEDCVDVARRFGVDITFTLVEADFVDWACCQAQQEEELASEDRSYDLVIQNPPYRRISALSPVREQLRRFDIDVPNLYAAFMMLGSSMLADGGQLLSITPRSFANGTHYRDFRRKFTRSMGLERISVFDDRQSLFADLAVLQENVILSAIKGSRPEKVSISVSGGVDGPVRERIVYYSEVIRQGDPELFVHVPVSGLSDRAATVIDGLPCRLSDLGVSVSTGRVVDFRVRDALRFEFDGDAEALIYPGNLQGGRVVWPMQGTRKPQQIVSGPTTAKLLMPAECYVLVKRFSPKEARRRLMASVFQSGDIPGAVVGFENHLNVFHSSGAGLQGSLAAGLSVWINSSILESYFRRFSGHTQVNVADLKNIRYPSFERLTLIGAQVDLDDWPGQGDIDRLVERFLGIKAP